MKRQQIIEHLNKIDLKFKKGSDIPKFCDQKTQIDVIECVSLCILNFKKKNWFTKSDIWFSKFSIDHVYEVFRKPISTDRKSKKEFDKFFAQPMALLTYFGVLIREKKSNMYYYTIANKKLLEYISDNQNNSMNFLFLCFESFLNQNPELKLEVDSFFQFQDKITFQRLKEVYESFIKKNTKIVKQDEPRRTFTPFINLLAFKNKKHGSERGHLSSDFIHRDELIYGRPNWKDIATKKPRGKTRAEWHIEYLDKQDEEKALTTTEAYAKKCIKMKHGEISEYSKSTGAFATHHIFPRSFHFKLCGFKENLIRITPDEHFIKAHPKNNTQKIDETFQIELLKAKLRSIEYSLNKGEDFYDLKTYIYVLNNGFKIDLPTDLSFGDLKNFLNSR